MRLECGDTEPLGRSMAALLYAPSARCSTMCRWMTCVDTAHLHALGARHVLMSATMPSAAGRELLSWPVVHTACVSSFVWAQQGSPRQLQLGTTPATMASLQSWPAYTLYSRASCRLHTGPASGASGHNKEAARKSTVLQRLPCAAVLLWEASFPVPHCAVVGGNVLLWEASFPATQQRLHSVSARHRRQQRCAWFASCAGVINDAAICNGSLVGIRCVQVSTRAHRLRWVQYKNEERGIGMSQSQRGGASCA